MLVDTHWHRLFVVPKMVGALGAPARPISSYLSSDYTPTSRLELERAPGIQVASIPSLGTRLSPTSTGITAVGVLRQMISNSVDQQQR